MNVHTKIENGLLIVTIDVSPATVKAAKPSKSGKSVLIASTKGNTSISTPAGTIKLGVNCYQDV